MSKVISKFKSVIRDFIPPKLQVPLKFYFNAIQSNLEPEMKLLKYFVKKNDLVIDIGGNRGVYAYKLWKLGARIEIFEPNPTCLKVLRPWASKKSNISLHEVGLSNIEGSVNLHIPVDENGIEHDASATIEENVFNKSRDRLVDIKKLDFYRFENVGFIKIDVEGHEYNVIQGANSILSSSKPILLIEIEQRHNARKVDEIFEEILRFGYKGFFFDENKLVTIEKFDVLKHQQIEKFGDPGGKYINNFVFLDIDKLKKGQYETLIKTF